MTKKIKILMGIPYPGTHGGPPTHLPFLVEYFKESDSHQIKTFYIGNRTNIHKKGVLSKTFATLRDILQFLIKLIKFRPQIVHINSAFGSSTIIRDIPYAFLAKLFRAKTFLKIHGSHDEILYTNNKIKKINIKILFSKLDKIGVLSSIEREQFAKVFRVNDKVLICKNIVPNNEIEFPFPNLNLNSNNVYGLFVSRIDHKKGLLDLLDAIQAIIVEIPEFILLVAGTGEALKNCKIQANKLRITSKVQWLGHVDSKYLKYLYKKSDIFIFPTTYPEGMPMSLIYALKTGIPIVSTEVRFAKSYLTDSVNYLNIEKNNPKDISKKVTYLFRNEEMKKTMKELNPAVVDQFTKEIVGKEFADIYDSLLY
jgi:glycosyltransferase involved in cell wall biosynthesis